MTDSLPSPQELKPLFIPLKTEFYDAFEAGIKGEELRRYGPRWNEKTCAVGRDVVLSKGYGKRHRMTGRIWKFQKQHASSFGSSYRQAVLAVFGTLDIDIACISIMRIPS
jgi:hypothetical protein